MTVYHIPPRCLAKYKARLDVQASQLPDGYNLITIITKAGPVDLLKDRDGEFWPEREVDDIVLEITENLLCE